MGAPTWSREGRLERYRRPASASEAAKHSSEVRGDLEGRELRIIPTDFFDEAYYLRSNPDVAAASVDPLQHYIRHGWRENRDPNPWLSTARYLHSFPRIYALGVDPLTHLASASAEAETLIQSEPTSRPAPPSMDDASELISSIAAYQPTFLTKWLRPDYLARDMGSFERAKAHLSTYRFLLEAYALQAVQELLFSGRDLHAWTSKSDQLLIRIALSDPVTNEGELSLTLVMNALVIYSFSFSIIEDTSKQTRGRAVFITRMQTTPAGRSVAKRASQLMDGVSPQMCLFSAAQGVCQALGIQSFLGVPANRQVTVQAHEVDRCRGVYDDFFRERGAELSDDDLFHGPISQGERPLSTIKAGHRIRTRRKRNFRHGVRTAAREAMAGLSAHLQPG